MAVGQEKVKALLQEMEKYQVFEKDLVESFISGSGSGGQKINKTQNCVYLKHLPTKIEVKCQKDRSREANRFFARRQLLEKIKENLFGVLSKKSLKEEKIRKQKKRRARRGANEEE